MPEDLLKSHKRKITCDSGIGVPALFRQAALFSMLFCASLSMAQTDHKTWSDYGSGPDSSKFMNLQQITKENVKSLTVSWTYRTQDHTGHFFNPIIVDNVMYVLARGSSL